MNGSTSRGPKNTGYFYILPNQNIYKINLIIISKTVNKTAILIS